MRFVEIVAPGDVRVSEAETPRPTDRDILLRMRACGLCGSDVTYIQTGPAMFGRKTMPLGHEPAGEIVSVGSAVKDLAVGERVVVNPMAQPTGVIGNGGSEGALAEYLLIRNAVRGRSVEVFPDTVPFEVAALNEPLAVARHMVNRGQPSPESQVLIFGAGPIGLGALLWLKLFGVKHVAVADLLSDRRQRALALGADAVIDPASENVPKRLLALHGRAANGLGLPRPSTDVYYDAAGAQAVVDAAIASARSDARLVIAAVHKKPVTIDTNAMLLSELTITTSMGYPTEIFETTKDLVANWQRFAPLISHRIPFAEVQHAIQLASTPGAADKVVVLI
jgi:(R,R)-butanediol dehydrogenase / meso-butanediol dehydrogenase / diacetyl reductase